MSKNQYLSTEQPTTENQNNAMSDDPGDGARNSFTARPQSKGPVEKAPQNDAQNQATIEEFGREGLGVAAKE